MHTDPEKRSICPYAHVFSFTAAPHPYIYVLIPTSTATTCKYGRQDL